MKNNLLNITRKQLLFPYLLVLFFVLHGFVDNYPIVPVKDTVILFVNYFVIATIVGLIGWLFYRSYSKAALFTFSILSIQFFFGPIQDMFKKAGPLSFLSKYSVLVPLLLIILSVIIWRIRKQKTISARLILYLNISISLLILLDITVLATKLPKTDSHERIKEIGLVPCKTCPSPDIYLIITDGYAGKQELGDLFAFDNTAFEEKLKEKGFYIIDSSYSNYNFTYFSISSMLNLDYLKSIKGINSNKQDQVICNGKIRNNIFSDFLRSSGYHVYNYSIFDMKEEPAITAATFLPLKTSLITNQTFTTRVRKDLAYHLATTFRFSSAIKKYTYADKRNNARVYESTEKEAVQKRAKPKFVFTHLMMPHYPYYFDSSGKENPFELLSEENAYNKQLYIGYLKYANQQLITLIDKILSNSSQPPVIILMSDHGFRELKEKTEERYLFQNFVAILVPGKTYQPFYKGITPVNIFRSLVNMEFNQRLPMLADSTVLIKD